LVYKIQCSPHYSILVARSLSYRCYHEEDLASSTWGHAAYFNEGGDGVMLK